MSCEDPPHEIMECKRHKIAQDGSCHDGINTKAPYHEARLPRRFQGSLPSDTSIWASILEIFRMKGGKRTASDLGGKGRVGRKTVKRF